MHKYYYYYRIYLGFVLKTKKIIISHRLADLHELLYCYDPVSVEVQATEDVVHVGLDVRKLELKLCRSIKGKRINVKK